MTKIYFICHNYDFLRESIMFNFCFIFLIFLMEFNTGVFSGNSSLPSWIEENAGFKEPKHINAIQNPYGAIDEKVPGIKGWVVILNEKKGHGVEIEINKLRLNSDSEDFLMVAPWPLTAKFKQIKLFTGNFDKTLKLRIPNTKSFFILYNAFPSAVSTEMALKYRRYGLSLEVDSPTTETPVKKNTVFEIQLKGKPPNNYSDVQFSQRMREALRVVARRYSLAHNISFNNDIPTEEMVRIHRVSFCPFEWPERDICASIEHSIYVSGEKISEDRIIKDYELTAEHLRDMWREEYFPELEELGLTVYVLPGTISTIFWWLLITGIIVISSLVASFVFWKAEKHVEGPRPRKNSMVFEVKKRPKLKIGKLQRIPSFMYDSKKLKYPVKKPGEIGLNGEVLCTPEFKHTNKFDSSSELPIKNYYGSLLFASNAAFEEDEGNPATES